MTVMWNQLREDIQCILQRDPAARSTLEVLTCYPGLHALLIHRLAHALWKKRLYWLGRFCSHVGRLLTGLEIHPGAQIGRRVFFDHGFGVVVGETAVIGDDCTIYQGVTLGGTSLYKGSKRHPTLESGVVVGAGAQILGGFVVGAEARIGSNAVVIKPVPAGATAVGNPARIITTQQANCDEHMSAAPESAPKPVCTSSYLAQDSLQKLLKQSELKQEASNSALDTKTFKAYAVDAQTTDPLVMVVHELIAHTAQQDMHIEQLRQALEQLGQGIDSAKSGLDVERLNKMVE